MGSGRNDISEDEKRGATNGNVTTPEKIGQSADKGAYRGEREQVGQDKPDPSVCAADVTVDIWGNTACMEKSQLVCSGSWESA